MLTGHLKLYLIIHIIIIPVVTHFDTRREAYSLKSQLNALLFVMKKLAS